MDKIDFKKEMKEIYMPNTVAINIVQVPKLSFLMIDGCGARDSETFKNSWDTLIRLAFAIKFIIKNNKINVDYVTMPVEALWSCEEGVEQNIENKSNINWTLCVMQPEYVDNNIFFEGLEKTKKKKGIYSNFLDKVKLESYDEGFAVQCLNLGPYDKKQESIDKLQTYIDFNNYKRNGKYHEIYIGDSKRARPDNLKTIIRQPVIPVIIGDGSQL